MDLLPPQHIIIVLVLFTVLSFITSLAKNSFIMASDVWIKQMAEEGHKRAVRAQNLLDGKSTRTIDCLDLFMLFFEVSIGGFVIVLLHDYISELVSSLFAGFGVFVIHSLSLILSLFVTCLMYEIFIILLPKRFALKNPDKTLIVLSLYIKIVHLFVYPFLKFYLAVAKIISIIFGIRDEDVDDDEVTEEEIRLMLDIGSESGAIDDDEKQMIHNIFEMDDKPVAEIMTHRTEVVILWAEDSIDEWRKIVDETNHTRYPVCGESIDDVLGVVRSRDFYRLLLSGGTDAMSILRNAWFIPDTIKADELFSKMQQENEHMGIVMDEYGGFQGIVTQEDLIEEIVGELYDEYDEPETEEKEIIPISYNVWEISGSAEIEDVKEALAIKIQDGDYNTFAGFVLSKLQTIPADGEIVEFDTDNMHIKVTSVIEHRIEKAQVIVLCDDEEVVEYNIEESH